MGERCLEKGVLKADGGKVVMMRKWKGGITK